MDLETLIAAARQNLSGILTADRYFRSIEGCFDGGFCPVKLFSASAPDQWAKSLKEAESRLVYADDEMEVKDIATSSLALTAGSIMDFDAIITSTRKDRDGDVLESSGAIVDPKCPLLWQHIPIQPIGKMVTVTSANAKNVQGRFAIADIELGRDAAALIEMGALRISHGFEPTECEPLEKDGRWHITKYSVMEVSLVSVPSNVDAVITLFSRNKLHSPFAKAWGEKLWQGRPVQGKGFEAEGLHVKPGDQPSASKWNALVDLAAGISSEKSTCECQEKAKAPGESAAAMILDQVIKEASEIAIETKSGRRISTSNRKKLEAAMGDMDHVCGMDDVSRPAKALCESAHGKIKSVLDADVQKPEVSEGTGEPNPPQAQSYEAIAAKCLAGAEQNTKSAIRLRDALTAILDRAESENEYGGVLELLNA